MTRVFFLNSQTAMKFDSYSQAREFADEWTDRHPGSEWMVDDDGEIVIDEDQD